MLPPVMLSPRGLDSESHLCSVNIRRADRETPTKQDSGGFSKDVMKISHIRNVTVQLSRKGFSERIR